MRGANAKLIRKYVRLLAGPGMPESNLIQEYTKRRVKLQMIGWAFVQWPKTAKQGLSIKAGVKSLKKALKRGNTSYDVLREVVRGCEA